MKYIFSKISREFNLRWYWSCIKLLFIPYNISNTASGSCVRGRFEVWHFNGGSDQRFRLEVQWKNNRVLKYFCSSRKIFILWALFDCVIITPLDCAREPLGPTLVSLKSISLWFYRKYKYFYWNINIFAASRHISNFISWPWALPTLVLNWHTYTCYLLHITLYWRIYVT